MISNDKKTFSLYPCCVLVNGKNKDAIYDLQRGTYRLIPHALFNILKRHKKKTIGEIKEIYSGNEEYIDEYIDFLLNGDYGILHEKGCDIFRDIADEFYSPKLITNALFDYDASSSYNLGNAIRQLDELRCENLEIRFYNYIPILEIEKVLLYAKDSTLRDIELMIQYGEGLEKEEIIGLRLKHTRLRVMTIVNCPIEKEHIFANEEFCLTYTSQNVHDETACGVISPLYFLPKTELYIESLHHNNCLNAKISIDKHGNIKNCPSMKKSWGHFGEQSLIEIANDQDFQKMWHITKDKVKKCMECELRYMCQDCRAYIQDESNMLSTPAKCHYEL